MKLLVLSDSHGNVYNLRTVLLKHPEADKIVFLGDGENDFNDLSSEINGRSVTMVCGNCDFGSLLNTAELLKIKDKTVYITHGHRQHVKYGIDTLIEEGKYCGASLILFGHTHEQYSDFIDGMYILNPGSINNYQYALVDIENNGILISKMDMLKR